MENKVSFRTFTEKEFEKYIKFYRNILSIVNYDGKSF